MPKKPPKSRLPESATAGVILRDEVLSFISSREQILARISSLTEGSIARNRAEWEYSKLIACSHDSSDYFSVHENLIYLLGMPWEKTDTLIPDLSASQQILDSSHYGLWEVKERIMEFLAVIHQVGAARSPILCLVGAPGVGKTSLAATIARAVGRKFIKISLGGLNDSACIRGHMRTYRAATPGLVMQSMQRVGTGNPVMLLDEIDKTGGSVRKRDDVEYALLELLDPSQNQYFTDHYLEIPFDLSQVLFIATANSLEGISPPLRDRMEIMG